MKIGLFLGHIFLYKRPKDHKMELPWKEMREGYIKTMLLVRILFPRKKRERDILAWEGGREVSGVKLNAFESHFDNQGDHFSRKF